jgi:hypothetical protein
MQQSKKNWENLLKATLGPQYIMLRGHALQATHAAVFVHAGILPLISAVRSCAIATGLGTKSAKLGNKGGIGIAFDVSWLTSIQLACSMCALLLAVLLAHVFSACVTYCSVGAAADIIVLQ